MNWKWLEDFPTTNAQIALGMALSTLVILVPLGMMVAGKQDNIAEGVLAMLLGASLALSGVSTYQKVQKWREMPASGQEEPPPGAPTPRPDLGVPDRGVL